MKGRKTRATGGFNAPAEDVRDAPEMRVNAKNIKREAEERKHGGRMKRKSGGMVRGETPMCNAGRAPRKSGGRATSDQNPFTSARGGTPAKGRKVQQDMSDA